MRDQPVGLDPTSDSCAVMVWCTPEQAEDLGGSIGGSGIECDGDTCCAMVGLSWSDDHTTEENDDQHEYAWRECIEDIKRAGLEWVEV